MKDFRLAMWLVIFGVVAALVLACTTEPTPQKTPPGKQAGRTVPALGGALAVTTDTRSGAIPLDTGTASVAIQIQQRGALVFADTLMLAITPAAGTTPTPPVATDTTPPHITFSLSRNTAMMVGDTIRVDMRCYATGNVEYTGKGKYLRSMNAAVLTFPQSTVYSPATAKALAVGTTKIAGTCFYSPTPGAPGIEATVPVTVSANTASKDTVVKDIEITNTAGKIYAINDSTVNPFDSLVVGDSVRGHLQLCAAGFNAAHILLFNSCDPSIGADQQQRLWQFAVTQLADAHRSSLVP